MFVFLHLSQHFKDQHKSTLAKIILILICLGIPKLKPMFNGSDCWIKAANAESRLAWI